MALDIFLPVIYEQQGPIYLCGPACINMVLGQWTKNYAQLDVWDDVKGNTNGLRPIDAPSGDPGAFPNQSCQLCSSTVGADGKISNSYHCWYTSPEAMVATINDASPSPVAANYIAVFDDVIRRFADSIATFAMPAMFTTTPNLHWLVAYGYQYETTLPTTLSSIKWNAQYVTGLYVLNPSTPPGVNDLKMVTPRGFGGLLMKYECGATAAYPVVGGAAAAPQSGTTAGPSTFWTWVVSWLNPRRIYVPRQHPRQRRPIPPPPKRR